jgi:hypothetical protein
MRSYIISIIILLLVGCSAIDNMRLARTQNILVQTPHADGAKCVITDALGRKWKAKKTPVSVAVEDGHSPLQVICTKTGYKTTVLTVSEQKEELLTIDGKRVTMNAYDQFPTKAPRLIPTAIKEASSFVIDPTGQISTKYPNEISVWMEKDKWESEEEMRKWAYEKEVWQNEQYVMIDDDKQTDDARKAVRREKKKARADDRRELYEKVKNTAGDIANKAIHPKTYMDYAKKGAQWGVNSAGEVVEGTIDTTGIVVGGSANIVGDAAQQVAPKDAMKKVEKRFDEMTGKEKKAPDGEKESEVAQ